MAKPSAADPSVPITPWTDEAVPAIGAICSIASVAKLDEVKAKQAMVRPCMMTNTARLSWPLSAIAACTAVTSASRSELTCPTRRRPNRSTMRLLP